MEAMMRHRCGTVVDVDDLLCPGCGGTITEQSLTALDEPDGPDEPETTVQPVATGAPALAVATADGELLCPTEWCRRPVPPGATICDGCGRPLPTAAAATAPAQPGPTATPAVGGAARYGVVLPGSVRLVLTPGVALELGREAGPAVVRAVLAPLDTVSRRHASLTASRDGVLVRDLGSANGTYVDGVAVGGEVHVRPPAVLRLGQSVSIGLVDGEVS